MISPQQQNVLDICLFVARMSTECVVGLTVVSALLGFLPPIAAALAIVWYVIQIIHWWRRSRRLSRSRTEPPPPAALGS
jgi:hypothetical protein